jgi:hypothetical protein
MPTLLIKGLSEDAVKQLRRLKVELDCATWAELLEKLAIRSQQTVPFTREEVRGMKQGAKEFIALADKVSRVWHGPPGVLEESRRSRRHERN